MHASFLEAPDRAVMLSFDLEFDMVRFDGREVRATYKEAGLTGLELQKRLIGTGHAIPIIFITAFPDARVRTKALQAGAVCFLPKTVNEEILLTCIQSAVGLAHGESGQP